MVECASDIPAINSVLQTCMTGGTCLQNEEKLYWLMLLREERDEDKASRRCFLIYIAHLNYEVCLQECKSA